MRVFKNHASFRLAQNIRAFLNLEAGVTRGATPDEQVAAKDGEIAALRRELARARERTSATHNGAPPVFFVVGQQKSGTTWLMKMLDAHPEILCHGEGRFFGRDWRREKLKEMPNKQQQPTSLYNAILSAEDLRYWVERSPWSRREDPEEHLANLTRGAIDYFLTRRLAGSGKRLVGDKSPLLTDEDVKEISEMYPEARVIHIIRDGRDAVVSALHHMWRSASADNAGKRDARTHRQLEKNIFSEKVFRVHARSWGSRVESAREHGKDLLDLNYIEVRYEDLLQEPENEVRRLVEFLGVDASQEVVRECIETASFEQLSGGRSRGEEDVRSFFRKGVAGDWKNAFEETDKRAFKEEAGELLVRLGYEENGDW